MLTVGRTWFASIMWQEIRNTLILSVPGDTSYVANSMAVHNSAAGSIVAYTLGITKINPIKYSLLFERFLNPERVSMPDYEIYSRVY